MKQVLLWVVGILCFALSGISSATQIIHYDKKPITIHLNIGEERTILFGDHVQVGIPRGVKEQRLFRVQSAQGALHILANKQFSKQRIQVRRITDKHVILLDLITNKKKPVSSREDIKIIMPHENTVDGDMISDSGNATVKIAVVTPVDLTRYASQHLYGPARLHREFKGITPSLITVKEPVKLFRLADVHTESRVIYAVEGGGYYLSALLIKNKSNQGIKLNYTDINVPFGYATFQHHYIGPNGSAEDSTVLYLLSDKKMKETLYPWTYFNANVKPSVGASK